MPENDIVDRTMQAALALASERGWRNVSLADIASRAELPLLEVYQSFPSKTAILLRLVGATDAAVLSKGVAPTTDSPRDRLFEILMRRFDDLQARRAGTVAILRDLAYDPASLLCLSARLRRSMTWMLEAAGIPSRGCAGTIKVKGLALVYLDALRVWMSDDSADMARTMAAVDTGLRRAERIARSLPIRFTRAAREQPAPEPPAENPPPMAA